ncbi:two-component system sensor histidine kinase PhoQ [Rosenbergiella australiborealis]|uniref:histidine kinase n=1 Tax=Rosenbergiella australiborealis TaxID=1544696 RepID=A0ABS5T2M6_9GAMM|nr:two-component system sensor histidine kinase PhoQ [Rosenbergiella australiborealis]MBT0726594.1 two-component system sensor histidine kinase PhoQ [Rosenbergiella australiborealis]
MPPSPSRTFHRLKNNLSPLSLRGRFLLAASVLVLVISLCYGVVAVVGYVISFDKNTYQVMRGESNLFFTLAQWRDNKLVIDRPDNLKLNFPTLVFIYDEHGRLLWQLRDVPEIRHSISKSWLQTNNFYEIDTTNKASIAAIGDNRKAQRKIAELDSADTFTHSVAVSRYDATATLPALTIVVVDSIPQELQHSELVWSWFNYVLAANFLLVIPLLWVAARWSLKPIGQLSAELKALESGQRESLGDSPPKELKSLVSNLNLLLKSEQKRSSRYHTTLSDLTHSLKTPLAVLQSTLRSLRGAKPMPIEEAEPIMLEQISRISQQVGYYLHRASLQAENNLLNREIHAVAPLIDSLCSALNKVYQTKGVDITVDLSPELTFTGNRDDLMEVMGNVLDNACKYCLEFIQISAIQNESTLTFFIDDDGPGIPIARREMIFQRGHRVDTLRPGQGIGLSLAREIVDNYAGEIRVARSHWGGARMEIEFANQMI